MNTSERMSKQRRLVLGIAALLGVAMHSARADTVAGADLDAPFQERNSASGGTNAFFVYSERTLPAPAGPNAMSIFQELDEYGGTLGLETGSVAPGININIGGRIYQPVIGKNMIMKPRPTSPQDVWQQTLLSISGTVSGMGTYRFDNTTLSFFPALRARAIARAPAKGKAAALSYDPLPLPAGLYPYDHRINAVLELEPDNDRDFVGAKWFAEDSYGPLWTLEITAQDRVLTSPTDLDIAFQIHSRGQSVLHDGQDAPLNAANIRNALRAALVVSNGVATLTDHLLFPPETVYVLTEPTDYTFAAAAGIEANPASGDCQPPLICDDILVAP